MTKTEEQVREIKQSFRLMMNGVTAQSMRQKGVGYKLNWGASLADLQQMADQYNCDYDLAVALWKEDIRECKILATMLMPRERMLPDLAELWMEQTPSQEIAELLAFNLFQHLDFAPMLAYRWMASDEPLRQICAYQLLARLFAQGKEPNERGINEFLDQASTALSDAHAGVRHAAFNCTVRFSQLGDAYANIARKALRLDFL